jgi:hypothetical protein
VTVDAGSYAVIVRGSAPRRIEGVVVSIEEGTTVSASAD